MLSEADYVTICEQVGDPEQVHNEAEAFQHGPLLVLRYAHFGFDRHMRENMHDLIATSDQLGHPDLFLMVTCSPKWSRATQTRFFAQNPQVRTDISARLFCIKLKAPIAFLQANNLSGKTLFTLK